MYAGRAHSIRIDADERGFTLDIATDEGSFSFNIQDVAADLRRATGDIQSWVYEMNAARTQPVYGFGENVFEEYALDDPKHPTYHERMSEIHDSREGK